LSAAAYDLGGSILTLGVYKIGAAATITSPMTFDAQGNSDATFIIQIVGALGSTASVGNVILLNDAQSSNIFWVVEGAVSLGASTNMEGTILCDAAISFGATTTINGRVFAGSAAGTVGISTTTITLPTELIVPSVVGHRLYRFSNGNFVMQYGQGNYENIDIAKVGIRTEDYVLNPILKNATFFGWWLIKDTATNTGGTTLTDFVEYTLGIQGGSSSGLSGCVLRGNNGSDFLDISQTRTNLGINTTVNQTDSADKRFVTDANLVVIGNTSGTNTGDQDLSEFTTEERTSNTCLFNKNYIIGNLGARTGNILFDFTGVVLGSTTWMYHDNSGAYTFPTEGAIYDFKIADLSTITGNILFAFTITKTTLGAEVVQIRLSLTEAQMP
jgi:hypothetical protein